VKGVIASKGCDERKEAIEALEKKGINLLK
jgi:hypothetical protein